MFSHFSQLKTDLVYFQRNNKPSLPYTHHHSIINLDLFLCMTCHFQLASTETQAVIEASVMIARNNIVAKWKRDMPFVIRMQHENFACNT